jgi:CRP-like cAMP-binding protein
MIAPGTSLVEHDRAGAQLSVIAHGVADVIHHCVAVAELGDGQFVGAIDLRAKAGTLDVVARTATLIVCWPREPLEAYLDRRPDVSLALHRSIGLQVTRLLEAILSGPDTAPN